MSDYFTIVEHPEPLPRQGRGRPALRAPEVDEFHTALDNKIRVSRDKLLDDWHCFYFARADTLERCRKSLAKYRKKFKQRTGIPIAFQTKTRPAPDGGWNLWVRGGGYTRRVRSRHTEADLQENMRVRPNAYDR